MRHSPQITEGQIKQILLGFVANEPKVQITERVKVDRKTVYRYFNMVRDLPEERVYALIATLDLPACHKGHTSLKCLVCGLSSDKIMSEEYQEILRLRRKVRHLEAQLKLHNEVSSHSAPSNPIVRITL